MTTAYKNAKHICEMPAVTRKTVHIVIKDGMIQDAFADTEVDLIVYDLDTQDPEMLAEVEASVEALRQGTAAHEIEIL